MKRPLNKGQRASTRKAKQKHRLQKQGSELVPGTKAARGYLDHATPCNCHICDPHKHNPGRPKHSTCKRMGEQPA